MRYFALYLAIIAIIIGTIATTTGALANGVACELGSYGKIAAQADGRC